MLRGERYGAECGADFHDYVRRLRGFNFEQACRMYKAAENSLSREQEAFLACNDRFYLLTRVLGRVDAIHPWIFKQCRMVEKEPDGFLDLWARYHYKTSIITTAGSIQEMAVNPDITIALFSVTSKVARKFLRGIQETLEKNENLQRIFPDVFFQNPRRDAPLWALDQGLIIKRNTTRNEPTMSAWGLVDGMPTGGHWDVLLYNDIITEKLVGNQDMVAKATASYELSTNLGVGEGTRKWMEGTRYSFADTYGFLIEQGIVQPRIFPATHNGKVDDYYIDKKGEKQLNPVFVSLEQWQTIKKEQRATYAAQMLQNPLAGKQNTFLPGTLRRYLMRPRTINVYIMGDYASGEKKDKKTDYSAIVVVGIDHAGNKYLLDGSRFRMNLSERWQELSRLQQRWSNMPGVQFVSVGYERYGAQSDIQYFEEQMKKPGQPRFSITELNWPRAGLGSKAARIQRLEPDFSNNKFFFPAKVWRPNAVWWIDKTGRERSGLKPDGVDGVQKSGARECLWKVDQNTDKIDYRPIPYETMWIRNNEIVGSETPGAKMRIIEGKVSMTDEEREAKELGESYRITQPLKRNDPAERSLYDLTAVLIEEFIFDPFSLHDDCLDVLSRIYDMSPSNANVMEKYVLQHEEWTD